MAERNYVVLGETGEGFQILAKGDTAGAGPLTEEEAEARLKFYQRRLSGDYKNLSIARVEFKRNGRKEEVQQF